MMRSFAALLVLALASLASAVMPPSEDQAKARLESSPRHGELMVAHVAGGPIRAWVVHPERKDEAPVVIVVHEIFGLTDWIRAVADTLAAEGFIAVAPDLLSGKGTAGGGTETFTSRDDVTKAVSGLPRDEVLSRLDAVRTWALALPGAKARSATIGFCWGGGTSFAWALRQPGLDAAVVYYGPAPDPLSGGTAAILGLYGENDARVNVSIEPAKKALGARYAPHVFPGAGHGFLRAQSGQDGANLRAAEQAWPLTVEFLRERTS